MKRVVSISLGSSSRNKCVETEILGERILIERIGTDGDHNLARKKYLEFDGKVDCFGIGGCELGVPIGKSYYRIRAVQNLVKGLRTPAVDGLGIRTVVEGGIAKWLDDRVDLNIPDSRVMFCVAAGRYHMLESFRRLGCQLMICDAGFLCGIPVYTSSVSIGKFVAGLYGPLICRLPFSMLYPTGSKQTENRPRFTRWFERADIIADDFHYIRRYMPDDLSGKLIVTNTTTEQDLDILAERNVKLVCSTTPRLDGRSFGTNVMEAVLTAVAGKGRALTIPEIRDLIQRSKLSPSITRF